MKEIKKKVCPNVEHIEDYIFPSKERKISFCLKIIKKVMICKMHSLGKVWKALFKIAYKNILK